MRKILLNLLVAILIFGNILPFMNTAKAAATPPQIIDTQVYNSARPDRKICVLQPFATFNLTIENNSAEETQVNLLNFYTGPAGTQVLDPNHPVATEFLLTNSGSIFLGLSSVVPNNPGDYYINIAVIDRSDVSNQSEAMVLLRLEDCSGTANTVPTITNSPLQITNGFRADGKLCVNEPFKPFQFTYNLGSALAVEFNSTGFFNDSNGYNRVTDSGLIPTDFALSNGGLFFLVPNIASLIPDAIGTYYLNVFLIDRADTTNKSEYYVPFTIENCGSIPSATAPTLTNNPLKVINTLRADGKICINQMFGVFQFTYNMGSALAVEFNSTGFYLDANGYSRVIDASPVPTDFVLTNGGAVMLLPRFVPDAPGTYYLNVLLMDRADTLNMNEYYVPMIIENCGGGEQQQPSPTPLNLRVRPNLNPSYNTLGAITPDHMQLLWNTDGSEYMAQGTYCLYGITSLGSVVPQPVKDGGGVNQLCSYSTTGTGSMLFDYSKNQQYKYFKISFKSDVRVTLPNGKRVVWMESTLSNPVFINGIAALFKLKSIPTNTDGNYNLSLSWYSDNAFDQLPENLNLSHRNDLLNKLTTSSGSVYSDFELGVFRNDEDFAQNASDPALTNKIGNNFSGDILTNDPLVYNKTDVKDPTGAPLTITSGDNLAATVTTDSITSTGYHFYKMFIYGVTKFLDAFSDVTYMGSKTITARKETNPPETPRVVGDIWDCRPATQSSDLGDGFVNEKDVRETLRHIIGTTCNNKTQTGSGAVMGTTSPDINNYAEFYDSVSGKYANTYLQGTSTGSTLEYTTDTSDSEIRKRANSSQGTKTRYTDQLTGAPAEGESVNLFDAHKILKYTQDKDEYLPVKAQ